MKIAFYCMTLLALPVAAWAQDANPAQRMAGQYWAYKPATLTPYKAPNKAHWRLSEILASHRGQSDWVQPLVRNQDQEADYISLGPGKKPRRASTAMTASSSSSRMARSR